MQPRSANRGNASLRIVTLLVLTCCPAAALPGQPVSATAYDLADLKALEKAFVKLAEDVLPSVVSVQTYGVRDLGRMKDHLVKQSLSKGSGFVIDSDGVILTNHHVIEDAGLVTVVLHNGLSYDARVLQSDPRSDLAVLKIDAHHLLAVRWGSLDKVKVNQWVFACGNPFGLAMSNGRASVSFGVVSGLGRQLTHRIKRKNRDAYYGNLIETSAPINPGSSGGPLFNIDAEVIGVTTLIETSSGVNQGQGFAIPIDGNIRRIIETLRSGEVVRYGFMGVVVTDHGGFSSAPFVSRRAPREALIEKLQPVGGPAAQAGLRPRDVIIEFDGIPVESSDHFVRLVSFTPVGMQVEIGFLRKSVKHKTAVTLGDRSRLLGDAAQSTD